jgi:hypothetical protein
MHQERCEPSLTIGASLAPAVGFEPTTNRLTADRSTTELRWKNALVSAAYNLISAANLLSSLSYDTPSLI